MLDKEQFFKTLDNFLTSYFIAIECDVNDIVPGYILDYFVPSKKFAIEYCDFENHVEAKVGRNYHNNKSFACAKENIQLVQIFEDEWREKQDICKSMILHKLGISPHDVFARKCEVVELSGAESAEFFNKSHLAGGTRAKVHFALKHESTIVAGLSLRTPVQKNKNPHLKDGIIEVARFATLPYHNVAGGFGKLFKAAKTWAEQQGFKKILSYAELRTGTGSLYKNNGFEVRGPTSAVMYWYVKTSEGTNPTKHNLEKGVRYFRFKLRAEKPLTEKQVAAEAGAERLYGTVNNAYEMVLNSVEGKNNLDNSKECATMNYDI